MNFVTAELVRDDGPAVTFAGYKLPVPAEVLGASPASTSYFGKQVILGIRPSDFEDAALGQRQPGLDAPSVRAERHRGARQRDQRDLHHRRPARRAPGHRRPRADAGTKRRRPPLVGDKSLWTARVNARSHVRPGQTIELVVDTHNLHFFDPVSGLAIGHEANV